MSFPYQITDRGVTVFIDSAPRQFAKSHSQYGLIVESIHSGDWAAVRTHTDVGESITFRTQGRVVIENEKIFIKGKEVNGSNVDRILGMIAMKSAAVQGYIAFLDRTWENCSKATVENLFDFIEACNLPVTEDGCFLAYKYVRPDFTDCWTGTFDNKVGAKPRMPRNECDEDRTRTCSTGLHVCSLDYLGEDSSYGDRPIIVVKVAPEDVVCVPIEHQMAKMRTEGYEVLDVLAFDDGARIQPWFDDKYSPAEVDDSEVDESDSIPQVDPLTGQDLTDEDIKAVVDSIAAHNDETDDEIVDTILDIGIDTNELSSELHEIGPNHDALQAFLETVDGDRSALVDWTFIYASEPDTVKAVLVWVLSEATESPDIEVHFVDGVEVPNSAFPADPVVTAPVATTAQVVRGNAKLTAEQVREIKGMKDRWTAGTITLTAIGKLYSVHREQIARIFRGDTWSHIT